MGRRVYREGRMGRRRAEFRRDAVAEVGEDEFDIQICFPLFAGENVLARSWGGILVDEGALGEGGRGLGDCDGANLRLDGGFEDGVDRRGGLLDVEIVGLLGAR